MYKPIGQLKEKKLRIKLEICRISRSVKSGNTGIEKDRDEYNSEAG